MFTIPNPSFAGCSTTLALLVSFECLTSAVDASAAERVVNEHGRVDFRASTDAEAKEVSVLADYVFRVEGGQQTKYPYGVKSVKTTNLDNARRVCIRTILHAKLDFDERSTYQPGVRVERPLPTSVLDASFVYFLADRYCSPTVDLIGNACWKKNIMSMVHKKNETKK